MTALCQKRWRRENVKIVHLTPDSLDCSPREFQRARRIVAEDLASGPYVLADSDCLLLKSPVEPLLDLMARYPEFSIVSLMPSNATINPWTPENYIPVLTEELMEHVSVGGIRFCRKGALKDWPQAYGKGYDAIHCEVLRKAGFRVGYARNVTMNHLGEGFSTVWR